MDSTAAGSSPSTIESKVKITMCVAYHAPKLAASASKEMADSDEFVFFLPSDHPNYRHGCELYWFSSRYDVALSHAEWWPCADGSKLRLTLKCAIPANSEIRDAHNYCNVQANKIRVIEKIWSR